MSDEVKFDIDADASGAEREYKKVVKEAETLRQKLIEVGKAAKAAGDEGAKSFDNQKDALVQVAAELKLVEFGTAAVKQLYSAWVDEIRRAKDAHTGLQTEIVKTLGASRDLKNAPQIEAELKNITNLSPIDATQAFHGVTEASPMLDWQQRVEIVRQVAPLAPMGHDIGGMSNMAAKLAELDPTMSANDAADLALLFRQRGGEDFQKFGGDKFLKSVKNLQTAGVSRDESLAMGLAAIENNLQPTILADFAEKLVESDPNAGKPAKGPKSSEDKLKAQFYKLGQAERRKSLQSNPEVAGAVMGTGKQLDLSALGDTAEQLEVVRSAYRGNLVTQTAGDFEAWRTGRRARLQYANAADEKRQDVVEGESWGPADTLRNAYLNDIRERGAPLSYRLQRNAEIYSRQMFADGNGGDQLQTVRTAIQNEIDFNEGAGQAFKQKRLLGSEDAPKYDELVRALRENTAATKENSRAPRTLNIDAHTEQ